MTEEIRQPVTTTKLTAAGKQRLYTGLRRLFVIIAIGVVFWTGMWFFAADERDNNRNINPQVFNAFRAIERRCGAERFPHQTVRCQSTLALQERCFKEESGCDSRKYYDELHRFGFDLPAYYRPGYTPK